jgi:hypothetical protein
MRTLEHVRAGLMIEYREYSKTPRFVQLNDPQLKLGGLGAKASSAFGG